MARRERHLVSLSRIVGNHEIATAIWVIFTGIDDFLYLINAFTIEISPLIAIDWSEFSPFLSKVDISFDFFNKCFHFLFPFRCIFGIFLSEIIFFKVALKRPLIPYSDIIINEIFDIGIS
jgi:hypothetical protein